MSFPSPPFLTSDVSMSSSPGPPSTSPFDRLPQEIRTLIFGYVLSPPSPLVTLCGCLKRQEYAGCQQVIYNTSPTDPKLSLSLVNRQSYIDVHPLAPTKQSIQVCNEDCLFWTLKNTRRRFKHLLSSVIFTKMIKTVNPISHPNRDDLIAYYKIEAADPIRTYRWEILRHWKRVAIHGNMKVDSLKSLIQIELTFRVDKCRSCMRQRPDVWTTYFSVPWTVEEKLLGPGYAGEEAWPVIPPRAEVWRNEEY